MNKTITYLQKFVALALVTFVWVCSGNLFAQNQSSSVRSSMAVVTNFPFIESFETNSPTIVDWTHMAGVGYGVDFWSFATGAGGGSITTAYEGTRNARFVSNGNYGNSAYLISPVLDLSGISSPKLSFYLGQEVWNAEQNTTKMYYRTSATASWVQLANYTNNINAWTMFELDLPNKSATYQIAFEGINNYGRANVIDLVKVYENATPATVTSFPFIESFETSSGTLSGWRQINEIGTAIWTYAAGAGGGSITTAYEGTRNARFISNDNLGHKTKLVSPPLDLSAISSPKLTFHLGQEVLSGNQNTTKVYYRTSATASWVQITSFSGGTAAWIEPNIISLPNKSATYQIAFECTNNYGRANVIDLVKVYENATPATVTSFPFVETFETSSATLSDWRQINETGTAIWTYAAGADDDGSIKTAYEGTRNARFISNNNHGYKTKLVSPPLNLSTLTSPMLSFWHGQEAWGVDQNTTKLFYRTSATAPWVELADYATSMPSWSVDYLDLPNPSATYQIAFEGTNYYGRANVIDLVKVYENAMPLPVAVTIVSPLNGSINVNKATTLNWIFGSNTSQYELMLNTNNPPTTVGVPYTSTLKTSCTLSGLLPNTTYYWRVNVKNASGTTMGPIWSFTTVLNTGINDPVTAEAIKVYASGDVLYVETTSRETALVNVYNLSGQMVLQGNTNGDTHSTFNTSTLSNGIYMVKVVQNNGVVFSRKVYIKK